MKPGKRRPTGLAQKVPDALGWHCLGIPISFDPPSKFGPAQDRPQQRASLWKRLHTKNRGARHKRRPPGPGPTRLAIANMNPDPGRGSRLGANTGACASSFLLTTAKTGAARGPAAPWTLKRAPPPRLWALRQLRRLLPLHFRCQCRRHCLPNQGSRRQNRRQRQNCRAPLAQGEDTHTSESHAPSQPDESGETLEPSRTRASDSAPVADQEPRRDVPPGRARGHVVACVGLEKRACQSTHVTNTQHQKDQRFEEENRGCTR